VLGNFIMGALAVSFVKLSTPVVFFVGGSKFEVQKIVDAFMPNLLPLILVLVIWWLIAKKNVSPTWVMVALILIGVLGAYPIWPGFDPKAAIAIKVGLFG
jgi:mannose/fructose/N-acetylgalactosamine-specific phosphotransferase system component IID